MNYLSSAVARSCFHLSLAASRRESKYSDCHSSPFISPTSTAAENRHNFTVSGQSISVGQVVYRMPNHFMKNIQMYKSTVLSTTELQHEGNRGEITLFSCLLSISCNSLNLVDGNYQKCTLLMGSPNGGVTLALHTSDHHHHPPLTG